jgi:hypothetical protein
LQIFPWKKRTCQVGFGSFVLYSFQEDAFWRLVPGTKRAKEAEEAWREHPLFANAKAGHLGTGLFEILHWQWHAMAGSMIWVNYNDLTATSLESWLVREMIPKWP